MSTEQTTLEDGQTGDGKVEAQNQLPNQTGTVGRDDELELVTETVYTPESELRHPRVLVRGMLNDFWVGRELAWRLFNRNLRSMYRQTLLGLFWAFLPPLANTAVWVFLSAQKVISFDSEITVNYTVYVLTGMILWQAFIDAFQMPMNIVRSNKNMISKLRFPREALLLVGLGEIGFNLGIRILMLVVVYVIYGVPLHLSMFLAPIGLVSLIILGSGLGLIIMPIGTLYHDVGRILTMAIPFWMILTPIVYAPKTTGLVSLLNWLNPASPLLIFSRDCLVHGYSDFMLPALIYFLFSIPVFLFGLIVFRVSIPVLVERMSA